MTLIVENTKNTCLFSINRVNIQLYEEMMDVKMKKTSLKYPVATSLPYLIK